MSNNRLSSKIILWIICLVALVACQTGIGNIHGTVIDAEGSPVSGAMVQVAGHSVLTNEEGFYEVIDIPVGAYQITATKTDVGNLTSECAVRKGRATVCDLALQAPDE